MLTVSTLDRLFDDVMGASMGASTNARAFSPDFDVLTDENEILVVCDVPGVKREDLDITLEGSLLTIQGTRKFENKNDSQLMLGRAYGPFRRQFTLPDSLDGEHLSADLENGELTVRIPKHPKAKPVKIPIGTPEKNRLGE